MRRLRWLAAVGLGLCACEERVGDGDLSGHYAPVDEPFSFTLLLSPGSELQSFDWGPPCGDGPNDRGRLEADDSPRRGWLEPEEGESDFGWPRGSAIVRVEQLSVEVIGNTDRVRVDGTDVDGNAIEQTWELASICEG